MQAFRGQLRDSEGGRVILAGVSGEMRLEPDGGESWDGRLDLPVFANVLIGGVYLFALDNGRSERIFIQRLKEDTDEAGKFTASFQRAL